MAIDINKDIRDIPLLFFDVETTGLIPDDGNRIVEIGAVRVENNKVMKTMSQLIDPEISIANFITKLTGITNNDVSGKPKFADVFPEFEQISKNCVIIAHNAQFDRNFLYHEMNKIERYETWKWLDTLKLSKVAWPNLSSYKLQSIAKHLNIETGNAHRAKEDAIVCSKVFFAAMNEIKIRISLRRLMLIERSIE